MTNNLINQKHEQRMRIVFICCKIREFETRLQQLLEEGNAVRDALAEAHKDLDAALGETVRTVSKETVPVPTRMQETPPPIRRFKENDTLRLKILKTIAAAGAFGHTTATLKSIVNSRKNSSLRSTLAKLRQTGLIQRSDAGVYNITEAGLRAVMNAES